MSLEQGLANQRACVGVAATLTTLSSKSFGLHSEASMEKLMLVQSSW